MTLLGLSRTGRPARAPRRRETPAPLDVNAEVAALRQDLAVLDARLARLGASLRRPEVVAALRAVDGPFAGDAPAAAGTAALWLDRAREELAGPASTLAEAHVAAGGLASR
ncbi:hypothetical protein [Nocardioides sp. CFH 31398]|uniref:hypothetical protein n=1 Tax=Nocardioides sp. CFH 31398 TaxID=2919579 RepID=UPI001F055126|nr:hypothetical protein [Nocardioides sp. CFH 31398]MCH1868089.1 hypothetical protein [Nocardioides sp. CFH 31398]